MGNEKQKWQYKIHTYQIADTGDYDGYIQFTNGKEVLQSSGEEMEDEDCVKFCELLDMMPDLWSHQFDPLQFENRILKEVIQRLLKWSAHYPEAMNDDIEYAKYVIE